MLHLNARNSFRFCDGLTRRELLRAGALGFAGLTLPDLLRLEGAASQEAAATANLRPRLRSVVILFLSGGPSQLDMWDMKPDAPSEIRGTFQPIDTNVPGIQICEHMPRTARLAVKVTIVRSMSHNEADHIRGGYWMMTGGRLTRPIVQAAGMQREDRPHIGSALSYLLNDHGSVPPFVMIPE